MVGNFIKKTIKKTVSDYEISGEMSSFIYMNDFLLSSTETVKVFSVLYKLVDYSSLGKSP